jgi:predicted dehydrogenase
MNDRAVAPEGPRSLRRDRQAAPRPVGLAIVGCGGAAVDVARALARVPSLAFIGAMDRHAARAADLVGGTSARVFGSLDDVLDDPEVEAVYVGLPHDLLAPTALRVLEAGRHVLVEKPMGLEVESVRRLGREAAARHLAAGVMFEHRFAPSVKAARRFARSGAIGTIRAVRVTTVIDKPAAYWAQGLTGRSKDGWRRQAVRAGGGVVLMNTIHQLDVLDAVLDLSVDQVSGEVAAGVPHVEVEDVAAATLRLNSGAIVSIAAAAHAPGASGEERIEIDGTLGALRLPDPYQDPRTVRIYLRRPHTGLDAGRWIDIVGPDGNSFAELLGAFASAARAGRPPAVGAREAARALDIVLRIYDASRNARSMTGRNRPARGRSARKASPSTGALS